MKFVSLFSGIGGFDLALERAGMQCVAQVEIDRDCLNVLAKHFPNTTRYTDVRQFGKHNVPAADLVCGGFPCQDLSIAGRREGLAGERSGLWFEFARIIDELEPEWVVVENVPGLLSSNRGQDFAVIIRWLAERGYGVAWRVLDAQYFGVPQRRRRVFIVGHLGDGRAAEVLFERESRPGDTAPSREAGERTAATVTSRFTGGSNQWPPMNEADNLIAHALNASPTATGRLDPSGEDFVITGTLDRKSCAADRGSQANEHEFVVPVAYNIMPTNSTKDYKAIEAAYSQALTTNGNHGANQGGTYIAWQNRQQSGEVRVQDTTMPSVSRQWGTGGNNVPFVGVRRLTPTECERLQGFPDDYTAGQSDSARYRQLGNAVAVPVVEWIGRRIREAAMQEPLFTV